MLPGAPRFIHREFVVFHSYPLLKKNNYVPLKAARIVEDSLR